MTDLIRKELIDALAKARLPERVSPDLLKEWVEKADSLIALVKDKKYSRVQGIGDDFIPDTYLYNALGAVYSKLPETTRKGALKAYMNQMDNVNYLYVQNNHTPFIAEPLALSDIGAARPLYWPGMDEGKKLVSEHKTFTQFQRTVMTEDGLFDTRKVQSDFIVAYAALRSDMSSFGSEYTQAAHPKFLERVVEGIVTLRFSRVEQVSEIKQGHDRLKELLPPKIHSLVEQMYERRDWQSFNQFIRMR